VSPRAAPSTGSATGARAALVGLAVAVIAVGLLLLARARPAPDALDPRSSRPDGARGLVLLLEEQGATVDVTHDVPRPPAGGTASTSRVLVLDDHLDDAQRASLLDYATGGGVVVVADPASPLHGGAGLSGGAVRIERGSVLYDDVGTAADEADNVRNVRCEIGALTRLRGLYVDDGILFPVPSGVPQCFGDGATPGSAGSAGHAFVIRREVGSGTVIGLGDNRLFTNEWLRFADNSGLATALLVPSDGATVTIVLGSGVARSVDDVGTGDEHLRDLVRPGVWMAFLQLAVAFVVFAAARGIRVGRPVAESRPVPLAGSELVRATGSMMRVARHHERAGWMLRTELHRDLCRRYRIDHDSSVDQVTWTASSRDGLDVAMVRHALTLEAVDDATLLQLARLVDGVRAQVARSGDQASDQTSDQTSDQIAGADVPASEGATP